MYVESTSDTRVIRNLNLFLLLEIHRPSSTSSKPRAAIRETTVKTEHYHTPRSFTPERLRLLLNQSAIMAGSTEVPVEAPSANMAEGATGEAAAAPVFDLSKKKKKKKSKAPGAEAGDAGVAAVTEGVKQVTFNTGNTPDGMTIDGFENGVDANAELETADFPLPDFTGKKKRPKKKVHFEDAVGGADGDEGETLSQRKHTSQAWDGSDRDYTYAELINRAFQFLHGKNPVLASGQPGRKKIVLPLPTVAREGTKKTVFLNFGAICKAIHRQQDHLLAYMGAELGTTGNMQDGGRLVVKGRFTGEAIAKVLKRYMTEYVVCTSCRSPDTVLMRDANTRLYFVSCESCGAKRSVAPIKQGFMAQVGRRRR